MSYLNSIQTMVQQVAAAISTVLGIETMVLDDDLQIVAGTGKYLEQIGNYEAEKAVDADYLYGYLLKKGGGYVVDDISDPLYGPEQYGEKGEISHVISYNGENVGLISLVAFSEEQYSHLIDNHESILEYLNKMSELISSYLGNQERYAELNIQSKLLNTIVDSSPDAILVAAINGDIKRCNHKASGILGINEDELKHSNIDKLNPDILAQVGEYENGVKNIETFFDVNEEELEVLLSTKNISGKDDQIEYIIFFFNIAIEERQNAYRLKSNIKNNFDSIVGDSPQIESLKNLAMNVAESDSTIMITGESGTGKEMFAKAIHNSSGRFAGPFVTINCGAIPESLMESELFGYVDGAFTGAKKGGHMGKFEAANKGTVFIDEIGDLQYPLQVKLLRVLQEKSVERIGSNEKIDIDVKIISATHKDLYQMCRDGSFREDLYYRLNVIPLSIPPLRERSSDIEPLAMFFLKKYASLLNKSIDDFSEDAVGALKKHTWPGNIRELENIVEYSVNVAKTKSIGINDLPPLLKMGTKAIMGQSGSGDLKTSLKEYEMQVIYEKLDDLKNNNITKEELAKELGIGRTSLYRKLKELNKVILEKDI